MLMLGGYNWLVHISIVMVRIGLLRLLEKRWFVGVRATNAIVFVDIGQAKLAVFWINGAQREYLIKNGFVLGLCRVEDSNKPMGIICL